MRAWRRALLVTVAGGVVVLGYASPALADGQLTVTSSAYACSPTVAGQRTGSWHVASAVGTAGTVTSASVSGGSASGAGTGDAVPANGGLTISFTADPGAASVTLALSVHWDAAGTGGPADGSVQDTISLAPCQPKPAASFRQDCTGQVTVTLTNGSLADHTAGGSAAFTVTGTGGYRRDVTVNAGATGTAVVPVAGAAHIQVSAAGQSVADASAPYPGCARSASASPSRSRSPSPEASAASSAPADPAALAGTSAGPSPYPLNSVTPAVAAGTAAGRPTTILASALAFVGAVAGLAQWWYSRRIRIRTSDLSR